MTNETYWRSRKFWWGLITIYIGQFQTPALLVDIVLFGLLQMAVGNYDVDVQSAVLCIFGLWILFTKTVKMVPHFCRHPADLKFLPVLWLFSYLHGLINVYALCTLHNTLWGSQRLDKLEKQRWKGGIQLPDPNDAVKAIEKAKELTVDKVVVPEDESELNESAWKVVA